VREKQYRVNDDGEPSNTAGQPIYGQILAKDLTNVLVVVVRYYGGINLGVGGLMTAYKTTAKLILEESAIIQKTIKVNFQLNFEYVDMNKVMKIIKDQKLTILKQQMELSCEFVIEVRESNATKIKQMYEDLRCLKIKQLF
jgi:putative IMPACT (imprinted ancient) family translation regulator